MSYPKPITVRRTPCWTLAISILLALGKIGLAEPPSASSPIGVFDSGTGGLTVLEQILNLDLFDNRTRAATDKGDGQPDFCAERFVFLADQANMPYGTYPGVGKEPFLRELIENDARFLLDARHFAALSSAKSAAGRPPVKAIVIACNTATAYGKTAIESLAAKAGLDVDVIGVIDAGALGAAELLRQGRAGTVGVLATEGTVASGAYPRAIQEAARRLGLRGEVSVVQQGALGLASAIDGVSEFIAAKQQDDRPRGDYRGPSPTNAAARIDPRMLPRYQFDFSQHRMLWTGDRQSPAELQINSVDNYLAYHVVSLLEQLRTAPNAKPLVAVVLGCTHYPYHAEAIRAQLQRLRDYQEDGQYIYRALLASDVKLIDPARYVGTELYRRLAAKGRLAAALPAGQSRAEFYITVPRRDEPGVKLDAAGWFTYDYKYGRAVDRRRPDVQAVPLNDQTLASDAADRLATQVPATWSLIGSFRTVASEPAVEAKHGMVVSVSPPGSDVGLDVLKQGGNAVDAAVATALAMVVTWPSAGNIGGGGFMMIYPGPGQEPLCVEYRETAPAAATPTMLADSKTMHGHRVVGVPGTVAGLALAHREFGKLPWRELVMPAVRLARDGFVINKALADSLNGELGRATDFAEFQRVFAPPAGRKKWQVGDRFVQPDLARTLEQIAVQGPDAFYKGPVADQLVAEMKAGGGLITKEDLAAYKAKARKAIHGTYRGYDIYAAPPPSGGGITLVLMLNILENFRLDEPVATRHLMIEAMRRAYCDRARHLGDPEFANIPPHLTSKEYAQQLAGQIDLKKAARSEDIAPEIALASESPSTTHFSVIDASGMAVSNTYTLENSYGSRVVVRGAGFLLNNEMTDFNRIPGRTDRTGRIGTSANLIAPGKRMLSSQTPVLVLRDGRLRLVTGSPGGRTITNTVLCTLLNVIDRGMDVRQAVDAPRMHHQWFPDVVKFEAVRQPAYQAEVEALRRMGHTLDDRAGKQGDAHSIWIDPRTGRYFGAADHRIDGKAAAY